MPKPQPSWIKPVRNRATIFPWKKCDAGSACDTPRSFSPCRGRDLARLDRVVQARIDAALVRFATTGHGDVKSLKDRPGELRLRVGKWRVFFCLEPPDLVRVLGIENRGEAYWTHSSRTRTAALPASSRKGELSTPSSIRQPKLPGQISGKLPLGLALSPRPTPTASKFWLPIQRHRTSSTSIPRNAARGRMNSRISFSLTILTSPRSHNGNSSSTS